MEAINITNIRHKDLNLLAIFLGICEDPNLSRASGRLGLSQPALSHALARLREQFGDPLFVRSQRGLVATPRVATLLPQVRALLAQAGELYGPGEALDLKTLKRPVVIASTAYFEARTIAGLIARLQTEGPGLRLETRSLSGGFPLRELESGEFDVAVAAYFRDAPHGFRLRSIFRDRFVCVCAADNPYLRTPRALRDYLDRQHLQIEVPPGVVAPIDHVLSTKRKRRDIALRIGNFFTPPAILAQSGHLLTCPLSLAEQYRSTHALAISELPVAVPEIETWMAWHERNEADPFHRWLREGIAR